MRDGLARLRARATRKAESWNLSAFRLWIAGGPTLTPAAPLGELSDELDDRFLRIGEVSHTRSALRTLPHAWLGIHRSASSVRRKPGGPDRLRRDGTAQHPRSRQGRAIALVAMAARRLSRQFPGPLGRREPFSAQGLHSHLPRARRGA